MSKIKIYLNANAVVKASQDEVTVQDCGEIWCNHKDIMETIKKIRIANKSDNPNNFCKISVIDLIQLIYKKIDNKLEELPDVINIGETEFLIKWEKGKEHKYIRLKTIIVSLIILFGSAFAIMSFNEDVAVESLFQKLYSLINGKKHDGYGVLEFMYGVGIAIGILTFFNHFGNKKFAAEPTPIEIKMSQYEDDINSLVKSESESNDISS